MKSMTQVVQNLLKPYIDNADAQIGLRIDQLTASKIGFDGTGTGYTATNAQAAIDEADGKIETAKSDLTNLEEATVNVYGSKNIFFNKFQTQETIGVTWTRNSDDSISTSGQLTQSGAVLLCDGWHDYNVSWLKPFEGKDCIISGGINGASFGLWGYDSEGTRILSVSNGYSGGEVSFTMPSGIVSYCALIYIPDASTDMDGKTFYPMIRDARIKDNTYQPYSLTNQQLTPYALSQSNPNLLDNPWFTVNQRGATAVTTDWTYFVDRWNTGGNTYNVTVNNDKTITMKAGGPTDIVQAIEKNRIIFGKVYTLSVMTSDGVVHSVSGVINDASVWTRQFQMWIDESAKVLASVDVNPTNVVASVYADENIVSDVTIKAVKLERGTVSTLAIDTPPNYQQELAKCQRYFVRYKYPNASSNYVNIALGMMFGTNMNVPIKFPVAMRTAPTISVSDISSFRAQLSSGGNVATAISMGTYDKDVNHGTLNVTLTTSMDNGRMGIFQATVNNAYIDFSADL